MVSNNIKDLNHSNFLDFSQELVFLKYDVLVKNIIVLFYSSYLTNGEDVISLEFFMLKSVLKRERNTSEYCNFF